MPRLVQKIASYRLHRPSGRAVVTLTGKDHYLGPHGTPTSKAEYDRVIAEWLDNGRRLSRDLPGSSPDPTVNELILRYRVLAQRHYPRGGQPTREVDNIRDALRPLQELYGHTPAKQKRKSFLTRRLLLFLHIDPGEDYEPVEIDLLAAPPPPTAAQGGHGCSRLS